MPLLSELQVMIILVLPFFQVFPKPITTVFSWVAIALFFDLFRARVLVEVWIVMTFLQALVTYAPPGPPPLRVYLEFPLLTALALSVAWKLATDLWFGRLGFPQKAADLMRELKSRAETLRQPKCPGRTIPISWLGVGIWGAGLPILFGPTTYATYQWLLFHLLLSVFVVLSMFARDPISPGRLLGWLSALICSIHIFVLIWQGPDANHVVWQGLPELMLTAALIGLGLTFRSKRMLLAALPRWDPKPSWTLVRRRHGPS